MSMRLPAGKETKKQKIIRHFLFLECCGITLEIPENSSIPYQKKERGFPAGRVKQFLAHRSESEFSLLNSKSSEEEYYRHLLSFSAPTSVAITSQVVILLNTIYIHTCMRVCICTCVCVINNDSYNDCHFFFCKRNIFF